MNLKVFAVGTGVVALGMMIANVPAVLLGERVLRWLPMAWVHGISSPAIRSTLAP